MTIVRDAIELANEINNENRRPKYVKDMIGKKIKLTRKVTTKRGGVFFKGQKMWIREAHKGKNKLQLAPVEQMLILDMDGESCIDWNSIKNWDE